ncbi:MAG: sulfatase [Bacteroidota bacterium]
MSIRFLFIYLFFVLFFLTSCEESAVEEEKVVERPNIIFIMTDDHSKRAMSAYTDELIETPHLDQLANEGVLFDQAFCTNSICGPSRAVFLTGKFSHKNGFKSNHDRFDGDQATLAKYLQRSGYHTSVIGKWHLVSTPQGFDEYKILIGQGEYYNPRFITPTDTVVEIGYSTNLITDHAISLMDSLKGGDQPFFMMVHHKAPHRNWMPDAKHLKEFGEQEFPLHPTFYDNYATRSEAAKIQDMEIKNMFHSTDMKLPIFEKEKDTGTGGMPKANMAGGWKRSYERLTPEQKAAWDEYYEPIIKEFYEQKPKGKELAEWMYQRYLNDYTKSVLAVDDNVGRLMDYLKSNDLEKNTLVIYTSDQGFFTGEHGWYDKRFMYEPSLAIPLVFRYPNQIRSGIRHDAMIQNVDLAPTILDFADVDIPADMQGKSLVNILDSEKDTVRDAIYYHYYQSTGWHTVPKHLGVRTDRYKLIYYYEINQWELFDLQEDMEEMKNLYGQEGMEKITADLKEKLRKLIEEYEDDTAPEIS